VQVKILSRVNEDGFGDPILIGVYADDLMGHPISRKTADEKLLETKRMFTDNLSRRTFRIQVCELY
jgi:hypothetical protein